MRGLILLCPTQAQAADRSSAFPFVLMSRVIKIFILLRVPPLSIDVNSDLGLLHVVDALPLTHPGLVRGPCTPSPQASRAWRASHHDKIVMYPFSMISPPKLSGKGTPRLLAMGGRAGFDPSNPLDSRCKKPLVRARLQNSPILTPQFERCWRSSS